MLVDTTKKPTYVAKSIMPQIACHISDYTFKADADKIIITTGATQALDIVLRTLTHPGDTVLLESPTFFGYLPLLESLLPVGDDACLGQAHHAVGDERGVDAQVVLAGEGQEGLLRGPAEADLDGRPVVHEPGHVPRDHASGLRRHLLLDFDQLLLPFDDHVHVVHMDKADAGKISFHVQKPHADDPPKQGNMKPLQFPDIQPDRSRHLPSGKGRDHRFLLFVHRLLEHAVDLALRVVRGALGFTSHVLSLGRFGLGGIGSP